MPPTSSRPTILADARFAPLVEPLRERIRLLGDKLDSRQFAMALDGMMRQVLVAAFSAAGASEGSIWLADRDGQRLVIAYNSGPNASSLAGRFSQPVFGEALQGGEHRRPGIVSDVFQREQPFCENQVYRHAQQDPTLDRTLGVVTVAMIAVPLYFAGAKRGVVSCVQLKSPDDPIEPPGFPMESLMHAQLAADVVGRLLDHWLVGATVGWIDE